MRATRCRDLDDYADHTADVLTLTWLWWSIDVARVTSG